tara:strand:- start:555 stop:1271 length:717 start_codon:yes stop_codon:yes gene_type:complete
MAKDKKSFILYCDQKGVWDKLDNEQSGKLIKHIIAYVNDDNPTAPDFITELAFEPIKQQLKRDLLKWSDIKVERSESGKLGGIKSGEARREKKQNEANEANASKLKQNEANEAVNVNVNVNENVTVNVNEKKTINTVAVSTATFEQREKDFMTKLAPFVETYGKEMLRDFYNYWTERNENGKKMRFEMQKVFQHERRLITWSKNIKQNKHGKQPTARTNEEISNLVNNYMAAKKSGSI